jgi:hypothetical protein
MKIVLNKCYGGFGLSPLAAAAYLKRKGKKAFFYKNIEDSSNSKTLPRETYKYELIGKNEAPPFYCHISTVNLGKKIKYFPNKSGVYFYDGDIKRDDKDLIAVVEKLGEKANGQYAQLSVVEIPDDIDWEIDEYDGIESVEETHRSWG